MDIRGLAAVGGSHREVSAAGGPSNGSPALRLVPGSSESVETHGSSGEHCLQKMYGTGERAERFYREQVLDHLNGRMREFVGGQEMMFVASAAADGTCDSTFRAGPAGFVHVINAGQLVWPEYRGNG